MNGIWSARIAQMVILLANCNRLAIRLCIAHTDRLLPRHRFCGPRLCQAMRKAMVCRAVRLASALRGQLAVGSGECPRFNANQGIFPQLSPVDLGDALNVLSIAYKISFGIGRLALAIDTMGAWRSSHA